MNKPLVSSLAASLLVSLLASCGGGGSEPLQLPASAPADQAVRTGPQAPGFPSSTEGLSPSGRTPQAADSGYTVDVATREAVRLFYKTVFASSTAVPSGWVGDIASCNAGDTTPAFKAAALRRINWFRAMAGVPATVQFDPVFSQKAQQAALLMAANNTLSHTPPTSWTCYNATGAEAAGKSNIGLGTNGAATVSGYVTDPGGNNTAVGHRRWVLYPQTQFMGIGDVQGTTRANALWVQDANINAARPAVRDDFVAWPPRGYVPYATVYPRWSFSYPQADFSAATVTMTENGVPIATRPEVVANGFGENTLAWVPGSYADGMSWARPAADTVYVVTVSNVRIGGVARNFSYTTIVFDPDAPVANGALSVSGSSALAVGTPASYAIGAWPGASGYQWRTIASAPYALTDSADAGETNVQATISAGYTAIVAGIAATGGNSFHLAHTQPVDQVLQIRATLVGGAASSLSFASRLALSSTTQIGYVEASTDDGASWTTLFQQAGGANEAGFTTRTVSLASLADKTFLLRFRYGTSGTYFPQATAGVGWYIDDIRLTGVDGVGSTTAPVDVAAAAFTYTAPASGDRLLQARAQMYGYTSDWGVFKRVAVTAASVSNVQSDCLFNWAERNYPQLFAPAAVSQTSAPYYYRFYAGTQIYLGVSSQDGNVYYLQGGRLYGAGPAATWLATSSCPAG